MVIFRYQINRIPAIVILGLFSGRNQWPEIDASRQITKERKMPWRIAQRLGKGGAKGGIHHIQHRTRGSKGIVQRAVLHGLAHLGKQPCEFLPLAVKSREVRTLKRVDRLFLVAHNK